MIEIKDERLWRIARRRAEFRKSLYSYIVVNTFLWLVWWFTTGSVTGFTGYPWPIWVMLGWGIGLAKQYFNSRNGTRKDMAEREYERLKREQEGI